MPYRDNLKVKHYIRTSFSKDNLIRVNKSHLYKKSDRQHHGIPLHRFVLGLGNDVKLVGDHICGLKLDNRSKNLRVAKVKENSFNSRKIKEKYLSSIYKGVSKYTYLSENQTKIWRARLDIDGKEYFKSFYKEEEAAKYYDDLLREHRPSEFNRYNFPRKGELSAI